jgi:hypothetical protein
VRQARGTSHVPKHVRFCPRHFLARASLHDNPFA